MRKNVKSHFLKFRRKAPPQKFFIIDYKDIFHPISTEARQTLQKEVLELFEIELEKMQQQEEE